MNTNTQYETGDYTCIKNIMIKIVKLSKLMLKRDAFIFEQLLMAF